jgi:hypothetical protein
MSCSELERFVEGVEQDLALLRSLRRCRSRKELIVAVRRLVLSDHPYRLAACLVGGATGANR